MNKELLKGHLPVLILGILSERPRHGYAVCQALADRTGQVLVLGEGTVYPLLHRLELQGHIRAEWEEGSTGKPRKVYRVTASGRKLIAKHQAEWLSLASLFRDILGPGWVKA